MHTGNAYIRTCIHTAPRQIADFLFAEFLFAEKYCLNFAKNFICRFADFLSDWVSLACGRTGPAAPANPTGNPDFNTKKEVLVMRVVLTARRRC
jgi:hypothetical protein